MTTRAAIYARYSTDKQSKDSAAAQFATCEAEALRRGWKVVARYADEGISGAAIGNRPQFQRLYAAAEAGEINAVMVVDLSRLSRNAGDLNKTCEKIIFFGCQIVGVQDGYDSTREEGEMIVGMNGIIGQQFRRIIGRRTHGALKMRAQQGRSAGGRSYGYQTITRPDGTKWWEVDAGQAKVIQQIFEWYAHGKSPRAIAAELNSHGIPSPGASWARTTRRTDAKWLSSTINGDPDTGSGILCNPLYRGEYIWNRVRWQKHPDSGKRLVVEIRPNSEWQRLAAPELRIVDEALFETVQARRLSRRADTVPLLCEPQDGRRVFPSRGGRRSKYALSGLLKCGDCGANFVVCNATHYGCASNVNGGKSACANDVRFARLATEENLIGALRTELLTPERIDRFKRRVTSRVNSADSARAAGDTARQKRRREIETEIANLVTLAKAGKLPATLLSEMGTLETELARLAVPERSSKVVRLIPDAVRRYEAMVAELPGMLARDPDRARDILRRLLGEVRSVREENRLFWDVGVSPDRILGLAGMIPSEAQNCDGSGGRI